MEIALQQSVWISSPEYAGWLMKRGFHWRKLWKKRWVALHGAELVYMDKEPTLENAQTQSMQMSKSSITSLTSVSSDDVDSNPLGFTVQINNGGSPNWYLRASSVVEKKNWLTRINHAITIVRWLEDYEKIRVIGVGGTGVVYELLHKRNGAKYAMKEMEIKNKAQMLMALQEAEMLKDIMEKISHPNIMQIEKVFQVGSKFYLVFPLCTGGELYEHIIRKGHLTEDDAACLIYDLISGIDALHKEDILHLDIKPENILFDSMDDNAKIKITDFGLSKVLLFNDDKFEDNHSNNNSSSGRNSISISGKEETYPTMAELNEKIAQFFEAGILNREKLRGTIGYMSPELILLGHCSKATDVFAAGVVLYILLCGHPPFHSKSNREVLERTCRGQYSMTGPVWDEVSENAKDLVRKMLVTDPKERIKASEILLHPWITESISLNKTESDSDNTTSTSNNASNEKGLKRGGSLAARSVSNRSKQLYSMKALSNHVAQRRSEKLAMSVTRLMSSLATSDGNVSTLMNQIRLTNGELIPDKGGNDEDMLVFQNQDIRNTISKVISSICEDGKISIEQFLCVLKHFGVAAESKSGGGHLIGLFICRFIDRDGDGYITPDDLFSTQALIIQRSKHFLKCVFRIYLEAKWYPGRQLNFANYYRSPNKKGASETSSSKSSSSQSNDLSDNGNESLSVFSNNNNNNNNNNTPMGEKTEGTSGKDNSDFADNSNTSRSASTKGNILNDQEEPFMKDIVEPPKFITSKHVGEVFAKLGYNAESGEIAFRTLCMALARTREGIDEEEIDLGSVENEKETATTLDDNASNNNDGNLKSESSTVEGSDESYFEKYKSENMKTPPRNVGPYSHLVAATPKMDIDDFIA